MISLFEIIMIENKNPDAHAKFIIRSSMASIIEIIARNIEPFAFPNHASIDRKFADLIHFIQYNLLDGEKITVKYLASQFNVAETYFSEYFKRNSNETFQDYILKSKLKIAEARAFYTSQSFKEIAYELGFTDSSHLNKMMKKHYNLGMKEIRKHSLETQST
ncbi:AraC family transcriptional regulator [Chitinophaga sp. CF118]|uniref:helix-turn-helix domain-containing protein n=1 Tax=Chitinophaga sp. CF118 TaxID=1884367 RepID=UPI0015A6093B|nr:AraC family transcriptional regulator [Chitinophaga sp. CF118]